MDRSPALQASDGHTPHLALSLLNRRRLLAAAGCVFVGATHACVIALAGLQSILARPTDQRIATALPEEVVWPAAAGQLVGTISARLDYVAGDKITTGVPLNRRTDWRSTCLSSSRHRVHKRSCSSPAVAARPSTSTVPEGRASSARG